MTMSKDGFCNYGAEREQVLIAYLYDDIPADEKVQFNRHLSGCAICRAELDGLAGVRTELGVWDAPALSGQIAVRVAAVETQPAAVQSRGVWQRWREVPAWAQAAAAALVLGASLGMANVEISYTADGLSVRTGWRHQPAALAANAESSSTPAAAATNTSVPAAAMSNVPVAAIAEPTPVDASARSAAPAVDDEAVMRRVRTLVQESEKRQQRELALRLAEYTRESQAQRQADLVRIDRTLGLYQRNTGMEVLRTQQQLNSLVQRVSEQR
jgi:hypothetical protein